MAKPLQELKDACIAAESAAHDAAEAFRVAVDKGLVESDPKARKSLFKEAKGAKKVWNKALKGAAKAYEKYWDAALDTKRLEARLRKAGKLK